MSMSEDKKIIRCSWPGQDSFYVAYHDEEWGVPEWDDRALFEKLVLDGFQAGLSWITILRKRDNFRRAFDGFDPEKIACYDESDVMRLLGDAGIVRHRGKITATITNAQAWLDIMARQGFANLLWNIVGGVPVQHSFRCVEEVPAFDTMSKTMSNLLKDHGFRFCGPTIIYAFMQAVGIVNDHIVDCFRYEACGLMGRDCDGRRT